MSTSTLSRPRLVMSSPGLSRGVTAATPPVRRISSHSLLDGARELVIQHQGGEYHLRLTRNDKLILTK